MLSCHAKEVPKSIKPLRCAQPASGAIEKIRRESARINTDAEKHFIMFDEKIFPRHRSPTIVIEEAEAGY
ncbi:MAG: hypothetical protein DMG38_28840 [Acidobacteria bacterium]|nr:MAG: hypothetical protein DMG38_28840 [Acidobacteriota bacterium]